MSPATLLNLLGVAALSAISVSAQGTPLVDKRFSYPDGIPFKTDTDDLARGIQVGYNKCNSTTEGPQSLCQTGFVNSIDDFCLWAPPEPNSLIGNSEGESVAWCTKPGRGTRLIPSGALSGVQFMRTKSYVQVVGFIDQTKINIAAGDFGGELDPHGADQRGNPLGGLLYSTAFSGDKNKYDQVVEWHNFMGSNTFCMKACDQRDPNAPHFCEHIYDRIGCAYNAPNSAKDGVFESCEGDVQDFPGVYTGADGQKSTYKQPGEGTEPTPGATYTARIPASSNCVPYTSAQIYTALPSPSAQASSSANPSGSGSPSVKPSGSVSRSGSSAGPSATTGSGNGAATMAASGLGLVAAICGALFLL